MQEQDYLQSVEAWRQRRIERLTAEDGWLNLIGLWWFGDGPLSVGSASGNDVILPRGPGHAGTATLDGQEFRFDAAEGAPAAFTVAKKGPTRFPVGDFRFEAVVLAGRVALRARDPLADARHTFAGIEYFAVNPAWRVVADWIRLGRPLSLDVNDISGAATEVTITHRAEFEHDGRPFSLIATHGTPDAPQFVLRDTTSGKETYPASRFLFGEEVTDRTVVLDFNKAINPPCAFTDLAICPLPPPENVLPFRIDAGELAWKAKA